MTPSPPGPGGWAGIRSRDAERGAGAWTDVGFPIAPLLTHTKQKGFPQKGLKMLRDSLIAVAAGIVLLAMILGVVFAINWHSAGVEAKYYQSKGVDVTQREIFYGVEPRLVVDGESGATR